MVVAQAAVGIEGSGGVLLRIVIDPVHGHEILDAAKQRTDLAVVNYMDRELLRVSKKGECNNV